MKSLEVGGQGPCVPVQLTLPSKLSELMRKNYGIGTSVFLDATDTSASPGPDVSICVAENDRCSATQPVS